MNIFSLLYYDQWISQVLDKNHLSLPYPLSWVQYIQYSILGVNISRYFLGWQLKHPRCSFQENTVRYLQASNPAHEESKVNLL
jgi:hypothetical protein